MKRRYGQWSWEGLQEARVQYRAKHPTYRHRELMADNGGPILDDYKERLEGLLQWRRAYLPAIARMSSMLSAVPELKYPGKPVTIASHIAITFGGVRALNTLSELFGCLYCRKDLFGWECYNRRCPHRYRDMCAKLLHSSIYEVVIRRGEESWGDGRKGFDSMYGEFRDALAECYAAMGSA